jgi:CRP-like cAMP-binding protein
MKGLTDFLLQFGNLNKQQLELILSKVSEIALHKDTYLVEAGKTFNQVYFVLEGVMRICYYNNRGEEITKYFIDENNFIVNPHAGETMTEYVHAETDCRLIRFSQHDWNELSLTILNWDNIIHKIFHKALTTKLERRSSLVSEDATTRYLTFLEKFPNISNRVQLAHIASYLGITQQSLSRIRKNIR